MKKLMDLFYDKDEIMYMYESRGEMHGIRAIKTERINFKEIIFLVSSNTASASEVMIYSLKDHIAETKIIGETTTGKGIQVGHIQFDDGSGASFVQGKFYNLNKESYHKIGIKPDIEIEINYNANNYDLVDEEERQKILDLVLEKN